MANKVSNPMKVITGPNTRWSYANVWEAKSVNGGTPKFSVSLIIPNTDFFVPRGVVIKKDADKLVLENPGYIRVGKPQMLKGGESDPRNKALMKMFNMIDIGERAGSGIPTLLSTWKEEGWKPPVIEERFGDAARTTLTLPFQKVKFQSSKGTNGHLEVHLDDSLEKKIIELLSENSSYTLKELAEKSLMSAKTVQRALKKLKESGRIERVGGKRYGHWEIRES